MTKEGTGGAKRTSVVLSGEDRRVLEYVSKQLGDVSEMEAIRRSIRVMEQLLEHVDAGGDIVFVNGKKRQIIRFL